MFEKKCYIGKVVDNNSPDLDGRVKIKIEEIHYDIADVDCPWFKQDRSITSNIPEINDIVWCYFVDDFFKKGFYCNKVNLEAYHNHKYFNDNIKNVIGSSSTYPNMKFNSYANGVTIGVDSSAGNPEIVIYHPKANIFIDKLGKLTIAVQDDTTFKSDKSINIESTTPISFKSSSGNLKALLEKILDTIISMKTVGSPALHTVHPQDITKFTDIKTTDLTNLLK